MSPIDLSYINRMAEEVVIIAEIARTLDGLVSAHVFSHVEFLLEKLGYVIERRFAAGAPAYPPDALGAALARNSPALRRDELVSREGTLVRIKHLLAPLIWQRADAYPDAVLIVSRMEASSGLAAGSTLNLLLRDYSLMVGIMADVEAFMAGFPGVQFAYAPFVDTFTAVSSAPLAVVKAYLDAVEFKPLLRAIDAYYFDGENMQTWTWAGKYEGVRYPNGELVKQVRTLVEAEACRRKLFSLIA